MKQPSETVVFFGSGPVAAESLELLLENFTVEAVVTKPRAEHHRGSVPVLELAEHKKIPVYTVTNKKTLDELIHGQTFSSRLAILIDFGIIVSQEVIDAFELGIVNSHFSLLPEWRGADPITFSILSGQSQTGISLMLLTAGMDEGPLLAQATYDLSPTETTPTLTKALIELSNASLQEILPLYTAGKIQPAPQLTNSLAPSKEPTYSRKLTKADGELDFTKPATTLEREIRAFLEWPKSRARLGDSDVIITAARAAIVPTTQPPGTAEILKEPETLIVYCGEGYLCFDRLKPAGKKEMSAAEFIRGYGLRLRATTD
jgi:methionyl-tRNA formyltransferase